MYCKYKPGAEHISWRAKADAWKEKCHEKKQKQKEGGAGTTPAAGPDDDDSKPIVDVNGKKLALGNSLQAVLTTSCGLTPDTFDDIWAKYYSELGN